MENKYIVIQSYMVADLQLKGNELLVYAIINGFCQDNQSAFYGSCQYLAEWTNCRRETIISTLKILCDKGLLIKNTDGNKISYSVKKTNMGVLKNLTGGVKKPNTIKINNKDSIKEKEIVKEKEKIYHWGASGKVKLSNEHYNNIISNYGEADTDLAIDILNDWLETETKSARLARQSTNHLAYFKKNSWLWSRVFELKQKRGLE